MRCLECNRQITGEDVRIKFVRATRDEPAHDDEACRFCAPDSQDLRRARDAHLDRLESEARERPDERVLRVWSTKGSMSLMTPAQRAWCISEIASVEGYEAEDWLRLSDAELARGVLDAWRDYARDKGLY